MTSPHVLMTYAIPPAFLQTGWRPQGILFSYGEMRVEFRDIWSLKINKSWVLFDNTRIGSTVLFYNTWIGSAVKSYIDKTFKMTISYCNLSVNRHVSRAEVFIEILTPTFLFKYKFYLELRMKFIYHIGVQPPSQWSKKKNCRKR